MRPLTAPVGPVCLVGEVGPVGPVGPAPDLVVLAKAPLPGRSKTRLAPTFGPFGAAELAAAALQDTLDAVAAAPAARRVLVLDGDLAESPFPVRVAGDVEIVPQVTGGHAERIAEALAGCRGPALLIGMDTPQVTPDLLHLGGLEPDDGAISSRPDAWLGPAQDGGWWALGLKDPARYAREALDGVPMSTPRTGAAQRERLCHLGLSLATMPMVRDVDTADDAAAVAVLAPHTRFARTFRRLAGAIGLPRTRGVA